MERGAKLADVKSGNQIKHGYFFLSLDAELKRCRAGAS
ncbi:hypothetical protein C4K22_1998 [Pseudomonas chlororaphis subsp. aurantiaca]|nr:hypothetical protein C4K22_1998 [Pseudomonas chlororaphis subsp. aurantiaca]AZD41085.1 hypothetical protein C4K21_2001 [Pseudomonas chlororaphis subsp. aurantiaca]AZD91410.1 hypothetical protein C4K13_1983 [Pseudomonas chlororaphis subsp. aureofaciens]AZE22404.1 hypothetical protein C4K08_1967 [Pseudomonas chlororaphis subsp. aureofaciens]